MLSCLLLGGCRLERPGFADSIAERDAVRAHSGPACGVTDSTRLSGAGIGALQVGATVDSVRAACDVLADTSVVSPEGQPTPAIRVDLIRDTVLAELSGNRITRVHVRGAGIRTADGYGAGSTLENLMHWSDLTSQSADGSLFVMSPSHCGMSFRLAGPAPVLPSPQGGVKALKHTPGEVRANEVMIFGCANPSRVVF